MSKKASQSAFGSINPFGSSSPAILQQTGCRCTKFDIGVASILTVFLLFLGILAIVLSESIIPDNLDVLNVGLNATFEIEEDNDVFFIVAQVARDEVVCFQTFSDTTQVDPTLSIRNDEGDLIQFNDDIASDNFNSVLCHFGGQLVNPVLEINAIAGAGTVTVVSTPVVEQVLVGDLFQATFEPPSIFFAFVELNEGVLYDVAAIFLNAVDSAIKIRSLEGEELTEAFQSTVAELTARSSFVAPITGKFILEVREIFAQTEIVDLRILFSGRAAQPLALEEGSVEIDTFIDNSRPSLFQFTLPPFTTASFSFELNEALIESIVETNILFAFFEENAVYASAMLSAVIPGLSFRIYDIDTNFVLQRARSDIQIVEAIERAPIQGLESIFDAEIVHLGTEFEVNSVENELNLLLEISRWHPDYTALLARPDFDIGQDLFDFQFTVTQATNNLQAGLADQFDLFPDCDIDPAKHTFAGDTCDQGIVLFCRNEFFPERETENALARDFSDVCTCVEFLCAALVSGNNVGDGFIGFSIFVSVVFIIISSIALLLYSAAVIDLGCFGGLKYWIEASNAFKTWTLCSFFFLSVLIHASTRISLNNISLELFEIDEGFEQFRIPNPADALSYRYYEYNFDVRNDFLGYDFAEGDIEGYLLDNVTLEKVPDVTFADIRSLYVVSFAASSLKNFIAVVTFLDVSLVWLKAVKTTSLNREKQRRKMKQFQQSVLAIEGLFLLGVIWLVIGLAASEGEFYSVFPSLMVFFVSFIVMCTYLIGRLRLNFHFEMSKLASGTNNDLHVWIRIQRTSSVVIACSVVVMILQIYFMITIRNFDDVLDSANDVFALNMFLFQDICIVVGQIAIFVYLFIAYSNYKKTLYVDEETEKKKGDENGLVADTDGINTPSTFERTEKHPSVSEFI